MRLVNELISGLGRRGGHWIIFALLMLYTVSVYTVLGERLDVLDAIRHQLVIGVVLIGLCVKVAAEYPVDLSESKPLVLGIVLLFLMMLLQVPFAADQAYAKDTFIDYIVKQAMFTFFMIVLIRTPGRLRVFMFTFLFSVFWIYQESVRGLISGSLVWRNQGIMRLHGAVDYYGHPNGLSLIAVTSLPFIIYLYGVVRGRLLRMAMLGIAVLACVCIVFTGSRAGYLGTIAIAVFWWLYCRHRVRMAVVGVLAALVVVSVLPEQYRERFTSIGGEEAEGHSKDKRLEIMQDAWVIFLENPGGVGINSFMTVRMARFGRYQDTHNLYLQALTHIGIQGTLVFLYFMLALYVAFERAVKRLERLQAALKRLAVVTDTDRRTRILLARTVWDADYVAAVARAGRLYLVMLAVNGIFAHTLYLICWWFAAGLAIVVSAMTGEMEAAGRKVARQRLATVEAAARQET
ncbi:MAG: O-antigen ligase family protein [Krumholzibacteria bacterium]|nr:O-antigen ligase family protein [Candidatus Krumholzibacteria bacterium]